jgi:iron complex transport system substrate-binding protein
MKERTMRATDGIGRRGLLAGALGAGAAAALAACGSGSTATSTGPWEFTDDTGLTVRRPKRPTRIAGLTDAISSLWAYGIRPVAAFGYTAMKDDSSFQGRDLSAVKEVGRTYGEIDVESLAATRPDLIVTHVYPGSSGTRLTGKEVLYGFADQTQVDSVRRIAPIVAIEMAGTADRVVARVNDLAAALGADFGSPKLKKAKAAYDKAARRLTTASKKGLTVMAEAAYPDKGLYLAKAPDDPSLSYYAKLGVSFPDPGGSAYYWQAATWEQLDRHRTDVVLNSTRAMAVPELSKQPTFAALPAARAGQVFPWNFQNMDYVAQARDMDDLAGWLERSRKVT